MRRALLGILLLTLTVPRPARAERVVTVYTPHGKELLTLCEEGFEAAHPGVTVRWLDMGSQEILDRVRAEAERPNAQVWYGAPATMFMQAAEEGLLLAHPPAWGDAIPQDRRDARWRWMGTFLTPQVILYNHRRLDDDEVPSTFLELLDPRWEGQVVLREPLASGTMRTIFGAVVMGAPDEAEGFRRLARLDRVTGQYAANPTLMFQTLARGRATLTLWNLPDAMLQIRDYGFPFGYRIPTDGTPVLVDGIALLPGAGADAIAFLEYVNAVDQAVALAERFHRIPVRTDIPAQRLPEWMRDPIPAMDMDWERLAREGPGWMNHFDRRIKGRGAAYLAESTER